MKSVNLKTKVKSTEFLQPAWYRFSFYFPSTHACNATAMPLAAALRVKFEHVYFARYTGAAESRLDVIVRANKPAGLTQKDVDNLMKPAGGQTRWTRIVGPTPCEGSLAHAAVFEFVVRFYALTEGTMEDEGMDDQSRFALWNDVLHWAHNMVGYDYTDEARCHLHALDKINSIFASSIRLGNQMAAAQKKAARKTRKPANN